MHRLSQCCRAWQHALSLSADPRICAGKEQSQEIFLWHCDFEAQRGKSPWSFCLLFLFRQKRNIFSIKHAITVACWSRCSLWFWRSLGSHLTRTSVLCYLPLNIGTNCHPFIVVLSYTLAHHVKQTIKGKKRERKKVKSETVHALWTQLIQLFTSDSLHLVPVSPPSSVFDNQTGLPKRPLSAHTVDVTLIHMSAA